MPDRELTEQEKRALKEFEENDKILEDIVGILFVNTFSTRN